MPSNESRSAGNDSKRVLWAGAAILFLAAGFLGWHFLVPPSTDEEILLDLAEEVLQAEIERDYEELWDLIGDPLRESWSEAHARAVGLDAGIPGEAEELGRLEKLSGSTQAEFRGMEPEGFFKACRSTQMAKERRLLGDLLPLAWSDLKVGVATIKGDSAEVSLGTKHHKGVPLERKLVFEKLDGEWCYQDIGFIYFVMKFKTLERKFAAFLPKTPLEPAAIDLLIEVGPKREAGEDLPLLHPWLKERVGDAGRETRVLIDAAPGITMQRVVRVIDAVLLAEVQEVAYTRCADAGKQYEPGIRVDGIPLQEATKGALYTNPANQPATRRILTLGYE